MPGNSSCQPGSARDQFRDGLVEAAGANLPDEDRVPVRAHLYPLPEVVCDNDLLLGRRVVVDEQLRATAVALSAQQREPGNPGLVAHPINWNATLVQHHLVLLNTIFATIQLLLGLGIAWRPTVRLALAASIAWALGVWWFGEGLGCVLSGAASPLNGAPGAVIIYALLAVLLWPSDRITASGVPASFVAARAVGAR